MDFLLTSHVQNELQIEAYIDIKEESFGDVVVKSENITVEDDEFEKENKQIELLANEIPNFKELIVSNSMSTQKTNGENEFGFNKYLLQCEEGGLTCVFSDHHNSKRVAYNEWDHSYCRVCDCTTAKCEKSAFYESGLRCTDCHMFLKSKMKLALHYQYIHNKYAVFSCRECGISFSDKINLLKHFQRIHLDWKLLQCDKCSSSFTEKKDLASHIKTFHKKYYSFKCGECGCSFGKKKSLSKHVRSLHSEGFQCNICDNFFSLKGNLEKHIQTVHAKIKQFQCNYCGKSYSTKGSLSRHILYLHEKLKLSNCVQCDYSCSSKDLMTHMLTVHGVVQPIRDSHLRVHDELNELKCTIGLCEKKFPCKSSLHDHILSTHSIERVVKMDVTFL